MRGAFTGAVRDRVGRFELASQGTLFLDEVGDLPPQLQVKLLRVLQERQYERVGESTTRTTRARIIAATNADLRCALRQGKVREDLYYRLCVVPIEVPPLRERREDIAPLVHHFLSRITSQRGLVRRISPQAMRVLLDYSWPGNVRELANVIEYAVAVAHGETILPDDLPEEILQFQAAAGKARRKRAVRRQLLRGLRLRYRKSKMRKPRACWPLLKSTTGKEQIRQGTGSQPVDSLAADAGAAARSNPRHNVSCCNVRLQQNVLLDASQLRNY